MTDATSEAFAGTDRYEITGTLGAGGMGVVYDALDRERNVRVALKTLKTISPRALFRFKQEFRSLAGLEHPNLIQLHELVAVDELWFFTMDYVPGVELMDYVRPAREEAASQDDVATMDDLVVETREEMPVSILDSVHESRSALAPNPVHSANVNLEGCDLNRLRSSFAQLAEGLFALHSEGKLHRDIKPSNVLVTDEGHVVLLDFGLIAQMEQGERSEVTVEDEDDSEESTQTEASGIYQTMEQSVSGTAAYMAPEQAIHRPLSEASDWYAVGTMLYEALTGRLPFHGSVMDLLRSKIREHAPDPSDLVPEIPEDLRLLCLDLLARNPDNRPTGREILERLSARPSDEADSFDVADNVSFVGRGPQLRTLQEAFQTVLDRQTFVVEVDGLSGMGKSTLVDHFLQDVQNKHQAVILRGRCYEQESVPYKGIDNLIDELAKFLLRLPEGQDEELLVEDVSLLARIFPVLNQVTAVSRLVEQSDDVGDPRAIRSRGFLALAELFRRIGQTRPLVLSIDDLQWGDADSAILLNELLQSEVPLQIMIVLAFRGEYVDTSPCLKALRQAGWRRRVDATGSSSG